MANFLAPARRRDGRFLSGAATTVARRDLGPVQVLRVHAPRGAEPPGAGYADPGDSLVWAFTGAGAIVTTRGSAEVECDGGELLVNHMQRIDGFRMTPDYRALSIRIRAADLHLAARDVDVLSAAPVRSRSLLPRLIGTCATQLLASTEPATAAEDAAAARAILDLASAHVDAVAGRRTPPEVRSRELVVRARSFIDRYASFRSVAPQTVADHVGVPLRTLQRAFESDGTTVRRAIVDARLAHARALLEREQRLSVEAVAERTGFGSASVLSRTFAAAHGMPPAEWRERARRAL
ncbi:AraC family transcriptional regulator [Demequina soli]|uniref:AraC family transcriptional regulator n=1 Tax=Demequina soli TaxID=1638987 RepID=UPI00078277B6|nr:helix-turn-helix domain-containing protein [Demequina soli]